MSDDGTKTYFRALTIAGSDSGGGAGIQADLKTFSALGCFGMSAITALTAQNTRGVRSIHPVPPDFVAAQIDAVASDIGADAVKIGMLASAEIVASVADAVARNDLRNVVLDPVMIAKGGASLLDEAAIGILVERLFPCVALVTPNLPETEALLGRSIVGRDAVERAGKDLLRLGARAVLVKGGHAEGATSDDCLVAEEGARVEWLTAPRIATPNAHGTGCTLSAAVAGYLARGRDLSASVAAAKAYVTEALRAGADYRLGHGHGPLHHFHAFWS
jgi:hydroxymethylpyrimidine/phosphomethylpyrimidine kinase